MSERPLESPVSDCSTGTAETYDSVLSDDSYMEALDERLKDMVLELKMIDSYRTLVKQRKIESHKAKQLDPSDTNKKRGWAPEMDAAHEAYEDKVDKLAKAKAVYAASQSILAQGKQADYETRRNHCLQAMQHARQWCEAARVAASARLQFLNANPAAFSTVGTHTHIQAATDNINSAKDALAALARNTNKLEEIKAVDEAKTAAAAKAASAKAGEKEK